MLTVKQIATELQVDQRAVLSWINRGELRAVNVAQGQRRIWRIDRADLQAFLASRAKQPPLPRRHRCRRVAREFF